MFDKRKNNNKQHDELLDTSYTKEFCGNTYVKLNYKQGASLEDIVEVLRIYKSEKRLVYAFYNGVTLYSSNISLEMAHSQLHDIEHYKNERIEQLEYELSQLRGRK